MRFRCFFASLFLSVASCRRLLMARSERAPIFKVAYDLASRIENPVRGFSRYYEFAIRLEHTPGLEISRDEPDSLREELMLQGTDSPSVPR